MSKDLTKTCQIMIHTNKVIHMFIYLPETNTGYKRQADGHTDTLTDIRTARQEWYLGHGFNLRYTLCVSLSEESLQLVHNLAACVRHCLLRLTTAAPANTLINLSREDHKPWTLTKAECGKLPRWKTATECAKESAKFCFCARWRVE